MSTLTIKLPQGQLRWWRLRLPKNERGEVAQVSLSSAVPGLPEGGPTDATEAVYEFYDGCEGELRGVVSTLLVQNFATHYLFVLAYEQPSDSPKWEPREFVALYPDGQGPPFV